MWGRIRRSWDEFRTSERTRKLVGFPAIVFLVLSLFFIDAHLTQLGNDREANKQTAEYAAQESSQIKERCSVVAPAYRADCKQRVHDRNREQQRREYEVQANRDSAVWNRAMGQAAIFGGIVAVITIVLLYVTYEAQLRNIIETRRIGEAQVRCYLTGVSAEMGFTPDGNVVVNCIIKNTGQSPARDVRCTGSIWLGTGDNGSRIDQTPDDEPTDLRVDIAAGTEEELTFTLIGTMDQWKMEEGGFQVYFASLTVKVLAKDVFDLPVAETERFVAHTAKLPEMNAWLELKRSARFT